MGTLWEMASQKGASCVTCSAMGKSWNVILNTLGRHRGVLIRGDDVSLVWKRAVVGGSSGVYGSS